MTYPNPQTGANPDDASRRHDGSVHAGPGPGTDTPRAPHDPRDPRGPGAPYGSASHDPSGPGSHDPSGPGAPLPPRGPLSALADFGWKALLGAGLAAIVLGIMVLVWPHVTLRVVGILFGVYLLITGVFQLVAAFATHGASGGMRTLAFISGALSIVLGLFCFRGTLESILLLALWIGIGWLFRGITLTTAAAADPHMPARGWQAFIGVMSAIAGVVLLVSPFRSIAVLTVLAGIWLLVVGVTEIATALRLRRGAKELPRTM